MQKGRFRLRSITMSGVVCYFLPEMRFRRGSFEPSARTQARVSKC